MGMLKTAFYIFFFCFNLRRQDFHGGPMDKNLPANVENTDSVPGLGRCHMSGSNYAHALQPQKPMRPRAHALQQKNPPQ